MKSKIILTAAALAIVIPFGIANAKENEQSQARDAASRTQRVAELEDNTEVAAGAANEAARERVEQAKEAAKAKVEQAKEAAKARQIALKQDRCEASKSKLTEKLPQLSQNVTTIKSVLDAKYAKVTAIYESGKLSAGNYTELDQIILEKQKVAEAAIEGLDPSTITIDCNNNGLGVQLDSYRASLNEVKAALKDYRTALVEMVSALNAAADKAEAEESKPANDTDTAGGETTNTTDGEAN